MVFDAGRIHIYLSAQCVLGCVSAAAALATPMAPTQKAMQMVDVMLVTFILNWEITQEFEREQQ